MINPSPLYVDRVKVKMNKIRFVARQPQALFLVPVTSQFIALLAHVILMTTYWDKPTIPVYSPVDLAFILVQLVHEEYPCTSLYSC
jgi:hypothetical protein